MTDTLAILLKRLEEEQREHAVAALRQGNGDTFAYGKAVGINVGLERAKQLLEEVMVGDEERQRNL